MKVDRADCRLHEEMWYSRILFHLFFNLLNYYTYNDRCYEVEMLNIKLRNGMYSR